MRYFPLVFMVSLLCWLAPTSAWAQELECSPCTYNFGTVTVGSSASYSIQLNNTGHKELSITGMWKSGTPFSIGKFPLPVKIGPGKSFEVPIRFTPSANGQTDGVFYIVSNPGDHKLVIDASGTGESNAKRQLGISPATLSFGNVAVGSSASLPATLTASHGAVTISSDRSTSSEFAILGVTLPVTIPAGKSIPVTIQFTPSSSGTDPAKVGFISNAEGSPTVAQVTGTGIAQGSSSVSLSWDGNGSAVGYNVFRSNSKAGPFEAINTALDASTSYTDSTVVAGTTYYYATTAVNAQGDQSAYSNISEVVIPN
ncbi:MAG: choice-of-anchor D domain-containing protein [Terriglobales bacterium]|jgi:hypothetical protein